MFTSVDDNSVGGVTGSGSGTWGGIQLDGAGSLDLQHATFDYTGAGWNNDGYGLFAGGITGSVAILDDTFADNVLPISISTSASADVSNNAFVDNQWTSVEVTSSMPTVEDNSVTQNEDNQSQPAYFVDSSTLNPNLIRHNTVSGNGVRGFQLGGVVTTSGHLDAESDPWEVGALNDYTDTTLTVGAHVTLTVDPGTVVKGLYDGGSESGGYCSIEVDGTLDAVGTASQPIVFTSVDDNSVGGVTGSGSGTWGGIQLDGAGSLDLQHATFDYTGAGWNNDGYGLFAGGITGSVAILDDTFADNVLPISISTSASADVSNNAFVDNQWTSVEVTSSMPTVEDNSVTQNEDNQSQPAYFVDSSTLNPNLIRHNTVSGNGVRGFQLGGVVTTSGHLDAESDPWEVGALNDYTDTTLTVGAHVTLTVDPGTVVKGLYDGGSESGGYCSIEVDGTLDAVGTASQPIVFTSVDDNSVGGVTGSGSGTWGGIQLDGAGSLDLQHATFDYTGAGWNNDGYGLFAGGITGSVAILDDTFADNVLPISISTSASADVSNNAFVDNQWTSVEVTSSMPTVEDNSVTQNEDNQSQPAYFVDSSTLNPNLIRHNTVSGNGVRGFQLGGVVTTSGHLDAESDPWEVGALNDYTDTTLTVGAHVTLTVDPGTVVKGLYDGGCGVFVSGPICVAGTLDAVGTSAQPILFTSVNDNSVGGLTGSGSPMSGDWGGITVNGSINLEHTNVSYASTAIDLDASGSRSVVSGTIEDSSTAIAASGGNLNFRGSLVDDPVGVSSCDWGTTSCAVDASYTYWGNPSGPGEESDGSPSVCGAVWTSPYYNNSTLSSSTTAPTFGTNCDGSPTPDQQIASAEQTEGDEISTLQLECETEQSACQQLQSDNSCLTGLIAVGESASEYSFSGASDVVSGGEEFLGENAPETVSNVATGAAFIDDVVSAVDTIRSIASDILSCY